MLSRQNVRQLEGVGLAPGEVQLHGASELAAQILHARQLLAVKVERHLVAGLRRAHAVAQYHPREV